MPTALKRRLWIQGQSPGAHSGFPKSGSSVGQVAGSQDIESPFAAHVMLTRRPLPLLKLPIAINSPAGFRQK